MGALLLRFEQVETLFHQALAVDADLRQEWLDAHCAGNVALRSEIESLLDAHAAMLGDDGFAPAPPLPIPDESFGAYRAVRLLGRGGMSVVYLAERADGRFEQTVAIKLMAAHLAGDDFRRRFDTEGRILAALRHRHITRLLDGGISSAGRPYLVMEYVEGQTIAAHCDDRSLNIETRLRAFLQVAEAVEYAHRNLILHRDLKPANILVTGAGEVKLLDFGTASLVRAAQGATVTRSPMLTPRYASPEQMRGERPGIAGDVFSLGVVLYELLTGAWAFGDPESVLVELQRVTGDVSPALPAQVIDTAAAARRSASPDRLRRTLAGDLTAVMLKAIENDPARRYQTVQELAADVENYLDGRPVQARPQTALYRVTRFLRRRWLMAGATAVFITGLMLAAIIATFESRAAKAEAFKSEQVDRFLTEMLASREVASHDLGKYTVEQMLEAADQRLEAQHAGAASIGGPLALGILHRSLALGYLARQRYDRVEFHADRAIAIFTDAGAHGDLASTLEVKADAAGEQGRSEEAERYYKNAIEEFRRARNASSIEAFEAARQYAKLLSLGPRVRYPEARDILDGLIKTGLRDSSIPRVNLAMAMANRSLLLIDLATIEEAEAGMHQALETGRKEDPGGAWELDPLFNLTVIYSMNGNSQAGKDAAAKFVEVSIRTWGDDSASTAQGRNIWAVFAAQTGEAARAAEVMDQAMPVILRVSPESSLNRWHAERNASNVMRLAGRLGDAECYARESLAVTRSAHLSESDRRAAQSWEALGRALVEEKKLAEGIAALHTAEKIYRSGGKESLAQAEDLKRLLETVE
jgi:eukaryotic-like serine/threonine-protein kinase